MSNVDIVDILVGSKNQRLTLIYSKGERVNGVEKGLRLHDKEENRCFLDVFNDSCATYMLEYQELDQNGKFLIGTYCQISQKRKKDKIKLSKDRATVAS